jgi:hypothetical protein
MGGRLEHEIRLLPQVLSCSFSKDDCVVVLTDPSADPWKIQLSVERILQDDGSEATVRVIGPHEAVAIAATRTISPLVGTATVGTVAAIGIGALVGSLAGVQHSTVQPTHKTRVAIATATPFDSIEALRGLQFSVLQAKVPQPTVQHATIQPTLAPAARFPVETPDRTARVLPVTVGPTAIIHRPSTSPRFRPFQARATVTSPPASSVRAAPPEHRAHHGRRLPHWSEVLLPPHPNKQRGQAG